MKFLILLFSTIIFAQSNIVTSGTSDYTVGEIFPIMQQDAKQKEVVLSVPKYEYPIEPPKPIVDKKKNFFQKLIEAIIKIFKK